ncbi:hypothetical protein TNCV_2140651 [Trichonephila clavipes]|uniref:Uncharacterized protein n=1 Tax=Trichonephila clavipes TaxID=2585209 RepID=A0A8X6RU58_TRICX|nr:hypothetical protein TNCV_2140651 [Trichonephila clavipes]
MAAGTSPTYQELYSNGRQSRASSLISLVKSQGSLSAIPGWTFHHFDFVSKCLIATPSLRVPTTNQVVPSPPRTATPSGTTNNYDMGWRLALRAICPATALNLTFLSIPLAPIAQSNRIALEHLQPISWLKCLLLTYNILLKYFN